MRAIWRCAVAVFAVTSIGLAGAVPAAHAAVLLSDDFSTGNLATSSGPGGGFGLGGGGGNTNAYESGGLAVVGGGNGVDENIYSLNTFNPAGTTTTWNVNSLPTVGAAGVMIGWAQSGIYTCAGCGPEIWLEARNDRLVFDVVDNNGLFRYVSVGGVGSGPLTMELSLTATKWQFDVNGPDVSDDFSGAFAPGFAPGDVMAAAGGNLSAFASVRSDCPSCNGGDVGTFSHVEIIAAPEPSSLLLLGIAVVGVAGVRRGRRKG